MAKQRSTAKAVNTGGGAGTPEGAETITLKDEHGANHEFQIVDVIEVNRQRYAILQPTEGEEQAVIFRVEDDETMATVDDDEEFERVAAALEDMDEYEVDAEDDDEDEDDEDEDDDDDEDEDDEDLEDDDDDEVADLDDDLETDDLEDESDDEEEADEA